MMKTTPLFLLGFLFATSIFAQNENDNSGGVLLFNVNYAFQQPMSDLDDRFGRSSQIDLAMDLLTGKNFIFGGNFGFLFGTDVKEDVLANLRDSNGGLIGTDQALASVVLRQRGMYLGAHVGKLFTFNKKSRSGIRFTIGTGFFQHKIRVQDDNNTFPQVAGEYKKGYDRLTNGLALSQFIGYQILSPNRRINMYIGIEALQGFTQNRRDFNFDTMMGDDTKRLDSLVSLKVGWTILPLYINEKSEAFFY